MNLGRAILHPDDIVRLLGLQPHPEGGFYREIFRDEPLSGMRAHSTAIYYLLRAGEVSHWHRVDAAEIWHFYAGGPLEILTALQAGGEVERRVLGLDLEKGERPQIAVPANTWQSARALGAFALVGCTVTPGFDFSGFEMAPIGWTP